MITLLSFLLTLSVILNFVLFGGAIRSFAAHAQLESRKSAAALEEVKPPKPKPALPSVNDSRFGHKFPPIGMIRKALPPLDDFHVWESWVETHTGEPVFTLRLVETRSGKDDLVLSERKLNLYRDNIPDKDFTDWGRYYLSKSYMSSEDLSSLVTPILGWAKVQANMINTEKQGYEAVR